MPGWRTPSRCGCRRSTSPTRVATSSSGVTGSRPATGWPRPRLGGSKADSYLPLVTGRAVAQRAIEATGIDASPAGGRRPRRRVGRAELGDPQGHGDRPDARGGEAARGCRHRRPPRAEANRIEQVGAHDRRAPNPSSRSSRSRRRCPEPGSPRTSSATCSSAAFVGLLVGYLVIVLRRQLDTRVRTVADVEELVGAQRHRGRPDDARAARGERAAAGSTSSARRPRPSGRCAPTCASSPSTTRRAASSSRVRTPHEGKSTVSATLARVLGEAGQPTVHHRRRPPAADPGHGSSTAPARSVSPSCSPARSGWPTRSRPPTRSTSGSSRPGAPRRTRASSSGSQRMHALIDHLAKDHLVILDAPPLLPVTDAGLLSGMSDGTLLVLAVGRTHKDRPGSAPRSWIRSGAASSASCSTSHRRRASARSSTATATATPPTAASPTRPSPSPSTGRSGDLLDAVPSTPCASPHRPGRLARRRPGRTARR